MRTFTAPFDAAKNKKAHVPVLLLQIDWPSINGLSAKTVRLTDRGSASDATKLNAAGQDWLALVQSWGGGAFDLERDPPADDVDARIAVLNLPADFQEPAPLVFSELFNSYPPEMARATLYQWFEGESLGAGDSAKILVDAVRAPIEYDEALCHIDLVPVSSCLGARQTGNLIQSVDFPHAEPGALGKTIPIVVGKVEGTAGLPVRTAPNTELTSVAIPGDTVLKVRSTAAFSPAGQLVVDTEVISYTGSTADSFTGCQSADAGGGAGGIAQTHYNGDKAAQKISDHRFLFSDPEFGVNNISNLKIGGQPVDPAEYSVDLAKGEATFFSQPQKIVANDSQFLRVEFDAVAPANTAIGAANAMDPDAVTSLAVINQTAPSLKLQQITSMPDRGFIKRALLGVEHYEEEKLPNDSIQVSLTSTGILGTLKKPNANDRIVIGGDVDIAHSHLETIGGSVDLAHDQGDDINGTSDIDHSHTDDLDFSLVNDAHSHIASTNAERSVFQRAIGGVDGENYINLNTAHTISFDPLNASIGTPIRAEYSIALGDAILTDAPTYSVSSFPAKITINGDPDAPIFRVSQSGQLIEYINEAKVEGVPGSSITLNRQGFSAISAVIKSCTRRVYYASNTFNESTPTGGSTSKSGIVSPLAAAPLPLAKTGGVTAVPTGTLSTLARTGGLDPVSGIVPTLENATQEKSSRAVVEFFDLTQFVSDWNWFLAQEVDVSYVGALDGRSSYIVHVFFEVEFGVPKYEPTLEITADVEGATDDATGAVTGTANSLIERPDHVFKWSLLKLAGLTIADIDAASFDAAGTLFAQAVAGGYKLAGVVDKKTSLQTLWAVWERESRSKMFWDSLGQARLQFLPLNTSVGATPVKSIAGDAIRFEESKGRSRVRARRSQFTDLVNRIELKYKYDPAGDSYPQACVIEDAVSQSLFGKREAPGEFEFQWVRSADTARDLADFYLADRAYPSTFLTVDAFLDNMELERGDVVDFTHPLNNMQSVIARVVDAERLIGSASDGSMDMIRLDLRIPILLIQESLFEGAALSEAVSHQLLSVLAESVLGSEAIFSFDQTAQLETALAAESLQALLKPLLVENLDAAESLKVSWSGSFSSAARVFEVAMVAGLSGGYGAQPYSISGYGGWEDVDAPVFRCWDLDTTDIAESLAQRWRTFDAAQVAEMAYTHNSQGYGIQLYGLSGYGGREILS